MYPSCHLKYDKVEDGHDALLLYLVGTAGTPGYLQVQEGVQVSGAVHRRQTVLPNQQGLLQRPRSNRSEGEVPGSYPVTEYQTKPSNLRRVGQVLPQKVDFGFLCKNAEEKLVTFMR